MKSLTGLEKLNTIEGNLSIGGYSTSWGNAGNPSLANLIGFESLTSIDGFMKVEFNDALTSLSGLSNLISIAGGLIITNNQALKNLEGLAKIDANSITKLVIVYNDSLATCDVESICDYLAIPNATIEIYDNAPGCNSQAEVDTACKYSFVDENSFLNALLIHPNPFPTSTTIEYELAKPSNVQLTIYDYLGKQVKVIEKKQAQGKQQIVWNAEGLPAGVYFCVLKTESGMHSTKLIKLK